MFAEGKPGAKKARADCVQGKFEQISDFEISQLLKFAKKQHFAIDGVEAREALTEPDNCVFVFGGCHRNFQFGVGAKKERAKSCFAAIGTKDFESYRV
jgi:hypothetical protein